MKGPLLKPDSYQETNPFSLEGVVTYPNIELTSDQLSYMLLINEHLTNYLIKHQRREHRYGGAILLRGEFGAGKTHTLTWIAQKSRTLTSERDHVVDFVQPTACYVQDPDSVFALHRSVFEAIGLNGLLTVIEMAKQHLAFEESSSSLATQSLTTRIKAAESLDPLYEDRNLDPERLKNVLRVRLIEQLRIDSTADPEMDSRAIPEQFLRLTNASVNKDAFGWLSGERSMNLKSLGLGSYLFDLGPTASLAALEALAALYALAEIPLLILVDQFDGLLRPQAGGSQAAPSILRKLTEIAIQQKAFVVAAGTRASCADVPLDVFSRLRTREPIDIGTLSAAETNSLLRKYTEFRATNFTAAHARRIFELSGGSPREIIRIAYQAYEACRGRLDELTDDELLGSARESGTVKKRTIEARQQIERILNDEGCAWKADVPIGGARLDWHATGSAGRDLGIMLATATDSISEVDAAKSISEVMRIAHDLRPGISFIVIAIGYATSEIGALLVSASATLLTYSEAAFETDFRSALRRIPALPPAVPVPDASPPGQTDIAKVLERLVSRLDAIETDRRSESEVRSKAFSNAVSVANAPLIAEQTRVTRLELLEQLAALGTALHEGLLDEERRAIRAILIANDGFLHDQRIERLSSVYVEALLLQQSIERAVEAAGEIVIGLMHFRSQLLAELKKLVQDGKSTTVQPLLISGVLAIALMIALGFFVTSLTAIFCPKYLSCSEYVVREFEIAKVVYFVGLTLGVATVALRIYRAWSAFDPSEPWVERMTAFRSRAEPLLLELRR